MKLKILSLGILLTYTIQFFGQINPVTNLTWSQGYEDGHNFFELVWDEPESPHDEIIGYNVYRENEFYIFINEGTSIYNIDNPVYGILSNCGGEDFLFYNDGGFNAHVTAVYNNGNEESTYTETVYIYGASMGIDNIEENNLTFYPNPTDGKLNIENPQLTKIKIYNLSGQKIKECEPQSQIDLSELKTGIYIIKLISDKGVLVDKIIIK